MEIRPILCRCQAAGSLMPKLYLDFLLILIHLSVHVMRRTTHVSEADRFVHMSVARQAYGMQDVRYASFFVGVPSHRRYPRSSPSPLFKGCFTSRHVPPPSLGRASRGRSRTVPEGRFLAQLLNCSFCICMVSRASPCLQVTTASPRPGSTLDPEEAISFRKVLSGPRAQSFQALTFEQQFCGRASMQCFVCSSSFL